MACSAFHYYIKLWVGCKGQQWQKEKLLRPKSQMGLSKATRQPENQLIHIKEHYQTKKLRIKLQKGKHQVLSIPNLMYKFSSIIGHHR